MPEPRGKRTQPRASRPAPNVARVIAAAIVPPHKAPRTHRKATNALMRGQFDPFNKQQQSRLRKEASTEAKHRAQRKPSLKERAKRADIAYIRSVQRDKAALAAVGRQTHIGGAARLLDRTLSDLATTAIYSPAGAYKAGTSVYHDVGGAVHGDPSFRRTRKLGTEIGKGMYADIQHPLRHPGFTLLDALGAASLGAGAVARGAGAAARVGVGGERIAGFARALDPKVPRVIRHGDLEVHPLTSRNRAVLAVQRAHDRMLSGEVPPKSIRGLAQRHVRPRRVGFELEQARRSAEAVQRSPAAGLVKAGKRLSTPQQMAVRAVAEETPLSTRIAFHRNRIKELKAGKRTPRRAAEVSRHRARIQLLRVATRWVDESGPKPRLTDPKLQAVYDKTKQVAMNREDLLQLVGHLDPEAAAERISQPGKLYRGQALREPQPSGFAVMDARAQALRGRSVPTAAAPEQFQGGEFRVPHARRPAPRSLGRHGSLGTAGSVGIPRTPGSLVHAFTGALQHHALLREDTTRLVGESNLEAQRFGAILHARDQIKKAIRPTQESPHQIPVRLDSLKRSQPLPPEVRDLITRQESGIRLSRAEKAQLAGSYDELHRSLFPDPQSEIFRQLHAQNKIGWVDERLLRGLNLPPLLGGLKAYLRGHPVAGAVASLPRQVNLASKAAILYLKPAYAVPNLLGNTALAIVQQGFGFPKNIAHSVRWYHALSDESRAAIMGAVGEGIAHALVTGEGGPLGKAVSRAANVWSAGVDAPLRWSSFVYEARRAGIRSPQELQSLVERLTTGKVSPAERMKFDHISRRANAALIDYGRLGPMEREIVRNVIFFYPWVKGSTLYAGHFLREHPVQAAVVGQLAKQGKAQTQADLGQVPSYAEGIFKVGGSRTSPLVVNPASTSILQTPAQVAQSARAFATGHVRKADNPLNFLTPALGAAEAAVTRRDPLTGRELKGSGPGIMFRQLTGGLPQVSLARRLGAFGGQKSKLYPMSGKQAAGQFLLGGVAPRTMDRQTANELARQEQASMLDFGGKVKALRHDVLAGARQAGIKVTPKEKHQLDQALKLHAARYSAYHKAHARTARDHLHVDVDRLVKFGKLSKSDAKAVNAKINDATDSELRGYRDEMAKTYGDLLGYSASAALRRAQRRLKDEGVSVLVPG